MKTKNRYVLILAAILLISTFGISFNRQNYVRQIVHMNCNRQIPTFFNQTRTVNGWKCTVNQKLAAEIPVTRHIIPSPIELAIYYISILAAYLIGSKNILQEVETQ